MFKAHAPSAILLSAPLWSLFDHVYLLLHALASLKQLCIVRMSPCVALEIPSPVILWTKFGWSQLTNKTVLLALGGVAAITWTSGPFGIAPAACVQNDRQSHGVRWQDVAAEVHPRQAPGLPDRAPWDVVELVLSRSVCLKTFSPWSLHYVNYALLFQVTALGRGRQKDKKWKALYTGRAYVILRSRVHKLV